MFSPQLVVADMRKVITLVAAACLVISTHADLNKLNMTFAFKNAGIVGDITDLQSLKTQNGTTVVVIAVKEVDHCRALRINSILETSGGIDIVVLHDISYPPSSFAREISQGGHVPPGHLYFKPQPSVPTFMRYVTSTLFFLLFA